MATRGYPLDYRSDDYRYIERPNRTLVSLVERHVLRRAPTAHILDVGAGAGANLRALRQLAPAAVFTAIEPNSRALPLLKQSCNNVHAGSLEEFLANASDQRFDAVLLSDVVEHVADPVRFLASLVEDARTRNASFFVSIPNFAVWYNRLSTLCGRFEYAWSGLRDRTHLRFFTRASQNRLFSHLGLEVVEQSSTPSLVQSLAPWLRRGFEANVDAGQHLALDESRAYALYRRAIEPLETRLCDVWPELFGFQIVSVLRCAH